MNDWTPHLETSSTRSAPQNALQDVSQNAPRASLQDFYDRELRPLVSALESERSSAWTMCLITLMLVAFGAFFGALYAWKNRWPPQVSFFVLVFGLVIAGMVYASAMNGYKRHFKMAVVERVVRYLDPQLFYDVQGHIPQSDFVKSQIFSSDIDRFSGEDLVQGTLSQTQFRFSQIHAEKRVKTKNGHRWVTIFQGLFFIADFNKNFVGSTVVLPDTAQRMFGNFGQTLQSWGTSFSGRELVRLEDPEFEQQFAVYSTDQIEARYILSPALMRRLLDLKRDKGCEVYVSFVAPHVKVALPQTHSIFEPPLRGPVLPLEKVEKFLDELNDVLEIITQLDLNTRIWTKD